MQTLLSTSSLAIRQATAEDVPRCVEMGRNFLASSGYKDHFPDNPEQMDKLARSLLDSRGGILVAERDARVVGMLGYIIYEHFISGERTAGEVFWWVDPDHRGDGLRLLREMERIAREAGATKMQLVAPDQRTGELYQRMGFGCIESAYQKPLYTVPLMLTEAFAPDAAEVRAAVISSGFTTEEGPDGALYTGISRYPVPHWYDRIAHLVGSPIVPKLSCFRLNLAGEMPHSFVHSDDICAQFATVLYLNLPEQCQGGTAFWKHPTWGNHLFSDAELRERELDPLEYHRMMTAEWKKRLPWEQTDFVAMRFNRFITYPTKFFHSRFPFEGFGKDAESGRLIWICFYDKVKA